MEITAETEPRDAEQTLTKLEFIAAIRQLANALEQGDDFEIEVDGMRVAPSKDVAFSVEHERSGSEEELEFQLKWSPPGVPLQDEGDDEEEADALP